MSEKIATREAYGKALVEKNIFCSFMVCGNAD